MQAIQPTILNSQKQPSCARAGEIYLSARQRSITTDVDTCLLHLSITNELFKTFESDIDMT